MLDRLIEIEAGAAIVGPKLVFSMRQAMFAAMINGASLGHRRDAKTG
jgi:hypothetical protein